MATDYNTRGWRARQTAAKKPAVKRYGDSNRQPTAPKVVTAKAAAPAKPKGYSVETQRLQSQLKAAGYNPGPIDGIWGAKTAAAYKAFQSKSGNKTVAAQKAAAPKAPAAGGGAAPAGGSVVNGGGAHAGQVDAPVGAPGGSAAPAYKQMDQKTLLNNARSAMEMELNPQLGELRRQLEMLTRGFQDNTKQTIDTAQRTDTELEELYKRLQGEQKARQDAQHATNNFTQGTVEDIYNRLQQGMGQRMDEGAANTAAELQRMGLGAVQGAATEGMTRDKGFLQELMGNNKTNALSNLMSQRDGFDQLMNLKQAGSAQESASRRSESRISAQEALQELMRQFEGDRFETQGKLSDLEATRGERLRQIAEQLSDKEYSRAMEQAQMQFQQQMARDQFGLERQAFEASLAPPVEQGPSYMEQLEATLKELQIRDMQAQQKKAVSDADIMAAVRNNPFFNRGR